MKLILNKNKSIVSSLDWGIIIFPALLGTVGLLVLYSAGFDPDTGTSSAFTSQAAYFGLSFIVFLISAFFSPNFLKRLSPVVYLVGILLLGFLVIKGGIVAGGARRWLSLGPVRMQPSEVMKIGVIMLLARLFSGDKIPIDGYNLKTLWRPALIMLFPALLIMKQPDLGTALCLLAIGASMLFVAGLRFSSIFKILLTVGLLAIPSYHFALKEYQRQRVVTFLSPESDPLGRGYHSMQSKIAVGSGALFGKGFKKGTQTQLRFLPEQTTDFIFSVLAEEWGFVGSVFVIGIYSLLILQLINLALKMQDSYSMYLTIGTASLIFWHTFINIGMVIGVLPVVGITLVIFSYGGSSLLTTMCLLGMVAGMSARRYMFS